jgi:hypothetical protein
VDGGGGAAHQKWRRRGRNHHGVTRWGERRPWCAPCASLSREKEKGGDRVRSMVGHARDGAPKEKKGGVRYGDKSENREPTRVPGTEGRIVRQDEVSAAQHHGHARAACMDPTTDGICRARSDSDLACAA